MDATLEREIIDELSHLSTAQQRQVLAYVRSLASRRPAGQPGKSLVRFAGTIEQDDLVLMTEAIEEGCEQVNADEW